MYDDLSLKLNKIILYFSVKHVCNEGKELMTMKLTSILCMQPSSSLIPRPFPAPVLIACKLEPGTAWEQG